MSASDCALRRPLFQSLLVLFLLLLSFFASACGGGGGGGGSARTSSTARFVFAVDLNGVGAEMILEVEAINTSDVVWGPGPNPEITAVIANGAVTYFTSGAVKSPNASYVFTGENDFADFTNVTNKARFRVRWAKDAGELCMIVNPFGPGPAKHRCRLVRAEIL